MGYEAGDYINEYLYLAFAHTSLSQTTLCIDQGTSIRDDLRGFGICKLLGRYVTLPHLGQLISDLKNITGIDKGTSKNKRWHRAVENQIHLSASERNPQFLFLYTYTPIGHTSAKNYDSNSTDDRNEYRKRFRKQSKLAAKVISDIVTVVKQVDPNAIMVVAGDHGTYVSRRSESVGFKRVDMHSVSINILKSSNKCTAQYGSDDFKTNKSGYHTISTVLLSLISCLARAPNLVENLPLKPRFSAEEIGATFEEFMTRNLTDEVLMTFPKPHK